MARNTLSGEVASYCERIEEAAYKMLERPNHKSDDATYRHMLVDSMGVRYESHVCDQTDAKEGSSEKHQMTNVFVYRQPQEVDECSRSLFSALYEHGRNQIKGFQDRHPIGLPQVGEVGGLTPEEQRAYHATLAMATYAYDHKRPSVDGELLRLRNYYDLDPDAVAVSSFTSAINNILASGAKYQERYSDGMLLIGDAVTEVSFSSHDLSGDISHAERRHLDQPLLSVAVAVGGWVYQYERTRAGEAEVMVVQDGEEARHMVLDSFEGDYAEDGHLDGVTYEEEELDAREQLEREMGFFVPRLDDLKFILARVGLLLPAEPASRV